LIRYVHYNIVVFLTAILCILVYLISNIHKGDDSP